MQITKPRQGQPDGVFLVMSRVEYAKIKKSLTAAESASDSKNRNLTDRCTELKHVLETFEALIPATLVQIGPIEPRLISPVALLSRIDMTETDKETINLLFNLM